LDFLSPSEEVLHDHDAFFAQLVHEILDAKLWSQGKELSKDFPIERIAKALWADPFTQCLDLRTMMQEGKDK
jgi:hypothetical protein